MLDKAYTPYRDPTAATEDTPAAADPAVPRVSHEQAQPHVLDEFGRLLRQSRWVSPAESKTTDEEAQQEKQKEKVQQQEDDEYYDTIPRLGLGLGFKPTQGLGTSSAEGLADTRPSAEAGGGAGAGLGSAAPLKFMKSSASTSYSAGFVPASNSSTPATSTSNSTRDAALLFPSQGLNLFASDGLGDVVLLSALSKTDLKNEVRKVRLGVKANSFCCCCYWEVHF